ncbi:unnamed protein product [Rangifer tarandus platyrhynchus]|uniref:Uncharacterized protein n=2 Tax=Rangifer tarandus platyrhynchus TaxID=3082113 RepID=A0ACB0E6M8_RANTA|nr:unnamed protein product [Rangifer tarandus platyrhynchus]CAI9696185.1 unnamed protein product [Rangifer tarandus platyrhynchus]
MGTSGHRGDQRTAWGPEDSVSTQEATAGHHAASRGCSRDAAAADPAPPWCAQPDLSKPRCPRAGGGWASGEKPPPPPRAPLGVRRRPRAHPVPRRPRAQSPREAPSQDARQRVEVAPSPAARAPAPPRTERGGRAICPAPVSPRVRSPRGPRRRAEPIPAPPPIPGHKSGSAAGEARLTCSTGRRGPSRTIGPPLRRARHSPGLPVPPGAAAAAAMSSRSPSPRPRCQVTPSNLGPGAARAAPRRASASTPPAGACGDCAAPGSLAARARPRGNGARRLGESPRRPRPRAPPLAPRLHESEPVIGQRAAVKG